MKSKCNCGNNCKCKEKKMSCGNGSGCSSKNGNKVSLPPKSK